MERHKHHVITRNVIHTLSDSCHTLQWLMALAMNITSESTSQQVNLSTANFLSQDACWSPIKLVKKVLR
jgi:hypothetical protein